MKKTLLLITLAALISLTSCLMKNDEKNTAVNKVELRETNGTYRLYINNEEFYVKGAGCECWDIESLAKHGANSFRTWMDSDAHRDGLEMLDIAEEHGLKVMMGIKVGKERHDFDYNDEAAVKAQYEEIKKTIIRFKDHPALLGWGIGNELNLRATNLKVWDAVNDISKMIHEIDGNHPTTTMLAGIGKTEIDYLEEINSDLDFLSIQMYGDIVNLQKRIDDAGYKGPYLVTEWGATGHWEMPTTDWGAAIESTSTEKARDIIERYKTVIQADSKHCMGSYVFLWGQKQERTPTWYGLFTENGEEMEAIGAMHYLWNGTWPENRTPEIKSASFDGKERYDNIRLSPGENYIAKIDSFDPDGDDLSIRYEILRESTDLKDGGDLESRPERIDSGKVSLNEGPFSITSPEKSGAYRLFLYVLDDSNHAATINFPFHVE